MSPTLPSVVDSTILSTLRTCQKKFDWEFRHHLKAQSISVDLHAGSAFAKGKEVLYRELYLNSRPLDEALARASIAFDESWGTFEPNDPKHPKTHDNTWAALVSYASHYGLPSDHVVPFLDDGRDPFEFSFALPLDRTTFGLDFPLHPSGDPFIYAGRFDLLGKLNGSIPVVLDDKTTRSIDKNWTSRWDLRGQFLGYVAALQALKIPCDTVVIRGIAIQKTQTVHAEAIKQFPRFLVERFLLQTQRDLENLLHCVEHDDFSYAMGDACTSYGGCPYLDLCISKEPENWFGGFSLREWNPLLRTETPIASKEATTP